MALQQSHPDDAQSGQELKVLLEIERETAETWGAQAAAAYRFAGRTTGTRRTHWLADAEDYRQVSLEHAAMTGDIRFIEQILNDLESARQGIT